jgi:hypothetical protein
VVPVPLASREAGTHTGGEYLLALVGAERNFSLQDEDHLVFEVVKMPHRRFLTRKQRGQVDSDLRQSQRSAERAFLTRKYAGAEGFRISGARSSLNF